MAKNWGRCSPASHSRASARPVCNARAAADSRLDLSWEGRKQGHLNLYISLGDRENLSTPTPQLLAAPTSTVLAQLVPISFFVVFITDVFRRLLANFKEAARGGWSRLRLCLPGAITLQHNFILRSAVHSKQLGKTLCGVWRGWGGGEGCLGEGWKGNFCTTSMCIGFQFGSDTLSLDAGVGARLVWDPASPRCSPTGVSKPLGLCHLWPGLALVLRAGFIRVAEQVRH